MEEYQKALDALITGAQILQSKLNRNTAGNGRLPDDPEKDAGEIMDMFRKIQEKYRLLETASLEN